MSGALEMSDMNTGWVLVFFFMQSSLPYFFLFQVIKYIQLNRHTVMRTLLITALNTTANVL